MTFTYCRSSHFRRLGRLYFRADMIKHIGQDISRKLPPHGAYNNFMHFTGSLPIGRRGHTSILRAMTPHGYCDDDRYYAAAPLREYIHGLIPDRGA